MDVVPQTPVAGASRLNSWGQEIGASLAAYRLPQPAEARTLSGQWCRLEALTAEHASALFEAFEEATDATWTYLPYGPFERQAEFDAQVRSWAASKDPLFFAVIDARTGRAAGVLSLLAIAPECACVEVGHIHYAPSLQRSPAATEAFALLARYVFEELGYRRLEWKCDALNAASRRAAERLGFQFEGVFRQHRIYKQRNRDTAWFSLLDSEWPERARALNAWLAPDNFSAEGVQLTRLAERAGTP